MFSLVAHTEMHGFAWLFSYFWLGTGVKEARAGVGVQTSGFWCLCRAVAAHVALRNHTVISKPLPVLVGSEGL